MFLVAHCVVCVCDDCKEITFVLTLYDSYLKTAYAVTCTNFVLIADCISLCLLLDFCRQRNSRPSRSWGTEPQTRLHTRGQDECLRN